MHTYNNNNISPIFQTILSSQISETKMGKKKNPLFPLKKSSLETPSSSWSWPSACKTPKTLSFRATPQDIFKTMNSTFLDSTENPVSELIFLEDEEEEEDSTEEVIRGLKSEERLVFEPSQKKVLEEEEDDDDENNEQSTSLALATSVESTNPFGDFKKSMEEMVEAHDLKEWDCLEELLTCYLKVNCKSNHGYIIGAFVELLVNLGYVASSSSSSNNLDLLHCNSFNSPLSYHPSSSNSSNSPCLSSSLEVVDDDNHDDDDDDIVEKPGNNVVVM